MRKIYFLSFLIFVSFVSRANWEGTGYYRVQNTTTNRIISIIGSEFTLSTDPDAFQNCVKMDTVGKEYTDPGTVIYIESLGSNGTLVSQGESTSDIISGYDFSLTEQDDHTIIASAWLFLYTAYLQDQNGLDIGRGSTRAKFRITKLDTDNNYFAVAPGVEYNGYFYTTLRVAFNFKLPENVYAYIIKSGNLQLYASPGEIVPKDYAVILKCVASEQSQNKLLPTLDNAKSATINDLKKATKYHKYAIHKGQFDDGNGNVANETIAQVNQGDAKSSVNSTYRILGVKDGKLGFYEIFWDEQLRIHNGVNAVTCLDGNRAYMNLSTLDNNGGLTLSEAPTISPATAVVDPGESITFNISSEATKTGAIIKFKIDDGEWQTYNGEQTLTNDINATADVTHTISVKTVNVDIESDVIIATYTFVAPIEKTLSQFVNENLDPNKYYRITTTPLTIAYKDKNNVFYAKDINGANEQLPAEGETDFMAEHYSEDEYPDAHYGDHSNWVAIEFENMPQGLDLDEGVKIMNIIGKVSDINNRTIKCKALETDGLGSYTLNTYSISNFFGSPQIVGENKYFFATPQPNEICNIVWAMWSDSYDVNGNFDVPSTTSTGESIGLSGSVYANFDLCINDAPSIWDYAGTVYKFKGLVRKKVVTGAKPKAISNNYVIYPLSSLTPMGSSDTQTAISNITGAKEVKGVKYYNAMGIASDMPFKGVNIVVTTYDNGTRTTTKLLK